MKSEIFFMERAIELAEKGIYTTSPNPSVGCVIVEGAKIISEGFHVKQGSDHAEIIALKNLKKKVNKKMVMYVTLEPCCHHGNTGPCTQSIINSGIKNIVISMLDPNPKVHGKGVKELRSEGINVQIGLLRKESMLINRGFISRIINKTPYIIAKQAISLDFKIAGLKNYNQISGAESRKDVHYMRARSCAILVGSQTVVKDNPKLTTRLNKKDIGINEKIRNPIRVVLDTGLNLQTNKYDFFTGADKKVVFNSLSSSFDRRKNIDFVKVKKDASGLNIKSIMRILAESYEINNLLIEPGSKLLTSLLAKNIIDELVLYQCPVFIGEAGISSCEIKANMLKNEYINIDSVKIFANDVRISYKFKRK
jgi:diaminohydroxyphosphoribosylaminopyrimidine deaminase/5-amino-6-(5-phosphoribosylamino)uracil reductase